MADYTDLSNAAVGIGGLPSGATVTALRDNPIAIAEAAVGAPKIQGAAAADVGRGLLVLTVSAADTVVVDRGHGPVVGTTTTASAVEVVAQTYTMQTYTGAMRFVASHNASDNFTTSFLYIYKNDVLVNSWSRAGNVPIERTEDITFVQGDVIEWRHNKTGDSSSVFGSPAVKANDGYVIQHLYAKFSAL
jgi:hypothetical protein